MTIKLKQLAQKLGLSQTTVSRALNGYPEVSEKTRRRVQDAAREHGYLPSHSARLLALGRSRTIGHVVPLSLHAMINPHFSDFISGAGSIYARHGYDMLISVVAEEEEQRLYEAMASSSRVDAVIVHGPRVDEPRIELLQALKIPFLVHGRSGREQADYAWLDIDNRRSFCRATRFLTDLGHRRIALLNGREHMNFAYRRRLGFLDGLARQSIDADEDIMFRDEMLETNGYRRMKALLARDEVPTAVLTSSVLLAMGAWRAVLERGLVLGEDISIMTHDDKLSFLHDESAVPLFTAMRSSILKAGQRCAELVIDMIEHPERALPKELWECELVVGSSTGPAPGY
jgi:LacI family transcriptional regulator, galactose operon repressor